MSLKQGSYTRTEGREAGAVYARFYIDTVEDIAASEREGRKIYRDEDRVEVIFPGNQHTKPVFKVTDEHKQRWPQEYEAFKAGTEIALNGTPIEQWAILRRAQVMELKALNFRTIEDVAAMNDLATQRLGMGGLRLRDLARAYLDDEQANALLTQTTAANERHERTIKEQNDKIANLSALCERLSSEVLTMRNAPSAIATYVPGQHDPVETARQAHPQEPAAQSSLMDLPAPRARKPRAGVEAPVS